MNKSFFDTRTGKIICIILGSIIILYQVPSFLRSFVCTVDDTTGECVSIEDTQNEYIELRVEVLGCLVSCHGISVRDTETLEKYQAYFQNDGIFNGTLNDIVLIKGTLSQSDCAYANTVFNGECVPSIEISAFCNLDKETAECVSAIKDERLEI